MNHFNNSFQYANFSVENWKRIIKALRFYIEHEQKRLAGDNFGELEWGELHYYEGLLHDVEYYVIGRQK